MLVDCGQLNSHVYAWKINCCGRLGILSLRKPLAMLRCEESRCCRAVGPARAACPSQPAPRLGHGAAVLFRRATLLEHGRPRHGLQVAKVRLAARVGLPGRARPPLDTPTARPRRTPRRPTPARSTCSASSSRSETLETSARSSPLVCQPSAPRARAREGDRDVVVESDVAVVSVDSAA
jgi:hypothetical protein